MLSSRAARQGDMETRRRGEKISGSPRRPVSASLVLLLLTAHCSLLTGCRRDMQDQPKAIAYRENSFFKDGTGSRPLVEGTVPRGYLRAEREYYFGKKSNATAQPSPIVMQGSSTNPTALYPDDVETIPIAITKVDLDRGEERYN